MTIIYIEIIFTVLSNFTLKSLFSPKMQKSRSEELPTFCENLQSMLNITVLAFVSFFQKKAK